MPITSPNPTFPQDTALKREPNDDLMAELNKLHAQVEQSYANRGQRMYAVDEAYRWRMGMVGRPFKHLPFPNSADLRYRLSESIIRKLKPAFVQSIMAADRIVRIVAQVGAQNGSAEKLEHFYNVFYRATLDSFCQTLAVMVDHFLEAGKVVVKITFDNRVEPQFFSVKREQISDILGTVQQAKMEMVLQAMKSRDDAKAQGQELPNADKIPSTPEEAEKMAELTHDEKLKALAEIVKWDLTDPKILARLEAALLQYEAGTEFVEIVVDRVVANHPTIGVVENLADLTIAESAKTFADADWIGHDMYFKENELRAQRDRYDNVDKAIDKVRDFLANLPVQSQNIQSRTHENLIKLTAGISQSGEIKGIIRVRELYCKLPAKLLKPIPGTNGDTLVRAVITYCPDALDLIPPLRVMPYPYEHGRWPFEEHTFNLSRFGVYYYEGVPQLINPYELEYNILRNAEINRTYMTLNPSVVVWDKAGLHLQMSKAPGQPLVSKVPPQQASTYLGQPDLGDAAAKRADAIHSWVEDLSGAGGLANLGGPYLQPPTAAQVNATMAPSQAILQFELQLFHDFMARVFKQVHYLFKQMVFSVHDANYKQVVPNLENPTQQFVVGPDDFKGDFILMPGGSINPMDSPVLKAQREFILYQALLRDPIAAPFIKPYNLIRQFATRQVGYLDAADIMENEKDAAEFKQQFMQMQAQAMAQMQQARESGKGPTKSKQVPNAAAGIAPN